MCMKVTVYVHYLSPCELCAHLESHVPEWLTMKYWHVQYKKRTCCCLDRRIQFQGRIVSGDDSPWRDVYQTRWHSGHIWTQQPGEGYVVQLVA